MAVPPSKDQWQQGLVRGGIVAGRYLQLQVLWIEGIAQRTERRDRHREFNGGAQLWLVGNGRSLDPQCAQVFGCGDQRDSSDSGGTVAADLQADLAVLPFGCQPYLYGGGGDAVGKEQVVAVLHDNGIGGVHNL